MDGKFKVKYTIKGTNYNTGEPDIYEGSAEIEFEELDRSSSNYYGNGHYMGIKDKNEPFGHQGYDIRYDKRFNENDPIGYIVKFYTDRYDGRSGSWKLQSITVER